MIRSKISVGSCVMGHIDPSMASTDTWNGIKVVNFFKPFVKMK